MNLEEIERRLSFFKGKLKDNSLDVALVFSPLNIYYLTGLWIKGFLFVTSDDIALFVRRPFEQTKKLCKLPTYFLEGFKSLSEILKEKWGHKIGLEYRAFSWEEGEKLKKILKDFELVSLDNIIWDLRMKKSPFEIACLREAGKRLSKALNITLAQFKPGMKELSASALLEKALRELGHPGYTRSANNFELSYGYLISGKEGLFALPFTTGEGGRGLEGFPGGASLKRLRKGEAILIDFSGFYKGYYVDQTRMASFGRVKLAEPFYRASLEILTNLEKIAKPGISCSELYCVAENIVKKYGFQEFFMRHGDKINFLGHGVGLEIDEPPVISPRNEQKLEENMVIALEPKFHIPDLGVIGLEDTFLVTSAGLKRLTLYSRDWIYLN